MITDITSLVKTREELGCEERQGYDEPFTMFTWAHWLEMQGTLTGCMLRFQRAIERREVQNALLIVTEMQLVLIEMHKETAAWVGMEKRG